METLTTITLETIIQNWEDEGLPVSAKVGTIANKLLSPIYEILKGYSDLISTTVMKVENYSVTINCREEHLLRILDEDGREVTPRIVTDRNSKYYEKGANGVIEFNFTDENIKVQTKGWLVDCRGRMLLPKIPSLIDALYFYTCFMAPALGFTAPFDKSEAYQLYRNAKAKARTDAAGYTVGDYKNASAILQDFIYIR